MRVCMDLYVGIGVFWSCVCMRTCMYASVHGGNELSVHEIACVENVEVRATPHVLTSLIDL